MKNIDIRVVLITTSVLIFVFIISILAVYLIMTRGSNDGSINNADISQSNISATLSTNESSVDDINKGNQNDDNNELENEEDSSNQENENDVTNTPTPTSKLTPTQSNVDNDIKKLETPVLSLNYSDKKFNVTKKEIQTCGDSTCYYIELTSKTENYKINLVTSLDENGKPVPSGYGFCNRSNYQKGIKIFGKNYDLTLCKNEQGYINRLLVNDGTVISLNQKNRLYIEVSIPEQNKITSVNSEMFDDIASILSSIR